MSLNKRRKIAALTGTRAEYGILTPVIRAIQCSEALELQLIVTGMHLSPAHGNTIDEIRRDGFPIATVVDMLLADDSPAAMAKSIGIGVIGLTQTLEQMSPDILLVIGDRSEPFAGAIAAAHLNIPIAHTHGGEATFGCVDDGIRHCITMLAHFHFAATQRAAARIVAMGQEPWRVKVVGAPALDTIIGMDLPSGAELMKRYHLDMERRLILAIQHPETIGQHDHASEMRATLRALEAVGEQTVLIYPNADAGHAGMLAVIREYENRSFLKVFENLPHTDYLGLLKRADVLVGNSSSGIIEAPSFHVPVVNIGARQAGRERAGNVLDVPYDSGRIETAILKALDDAEFLKQVRACVNPYGDGHASERIVATLENISLDERLLSKQWHDIEK